VEEATGGRLTSCHDAAETQIILLVAITSQQKKQVKNTNPRQKQMASEKLPSFGGRASSFCSTYVPQ